MPKTFLQFAGQYMEGLHHGIYMLDVLQLEEASQKIRACQGTVWLIGNGGSAALASHMATDLQLAGVRAQSLTDVSAITTYANDEAFSDIFICQLTRLGWPEDLLIAISGSGSSRNITLACEWARAKGMYVIGMSGFNGGELIRGNNSHHPYCDLHLHAPASHMGQAQDLQQVMLHIICYWLMEGRKG